MINYYHIYLYDLEAAKNGKLEICPPDQVDTSTIMSTSFGVVGIHLNDHWRGIGADKFIKGASNIADLMCISLGYQRSVPSIGTVKALAGTYTFTKCAERLVLLTHYIKLKIYLTHLI